MWKTQDALAIYGIPSETHLWSKYCEILFVRNILMTLVAQLFCNFAQSMAVSLPCSVQNFKTIRRLRYKLGANDISQDLLLRWISAGSPISVYWNHPLFFETKWTTHYLASILCDPICKTTITVWYRLQMPLPFPINMHDADLHDNHMMNFHSCFPKIFM